MTATPTQPDLYANLMRVKLAWKNKRLIIEGMTGQPRSSFYVTQEPSRHEHRSLMTSAHCYAYASGEWTGDFQRLPAPIPNSVPGPNRLPAPEGLPVSSAQFPVPWQPDSPYSQAGDDAPDLDDEGGVATHEEVAKPQLKKPPLYKVILINDDYTPMEFVVEVLETFFKMNREQATQIMLTVHTQGKGVCGIYTRDIAETKAAQVNQFARDHQHPLLCEIEASED